MGERIIRGLVCGEGENFYNIVGVLELVGYNVNLVWGFLFV